MLVIAASVAGLEDAQKTYQHLATSYEQLQRESADYYRNYLAQDRQSRTARQRPAAGLRLGADQHDSGIGHQSLSGHWTGRGLSNLGTGQRPGFAWFFGRDSLWTSFALNAEGDYSTTRTALDFISKYQREDGKVPHEISQSASLVPWFKDYPYAYVSADATPLFIIAMNDYAVQSGDVEFAAREMGQRLEGLPIPALHL